jgi:hypothetical protein
LDSSYNGTSFLDCSLGSGAPFHWKGAQMHESMDGIATSVSRLQAVGFVCRAVVAELVRGVPPLSICLRCGNISDCGALVSRLQESVVENRISVLLHCPSTDESFTFEAPRDSKWLAAHWNRRLKVRCRQCGSAHSYSLKAPIIESFLDSPSNAQTLAGLVKSERRGSQRSGAPRG